MLLYIRLILYITSLMELWLIVGQETSLRCITCLIPYCRIVRILQLTNNLPVCVATTNRHSQENNLLTSILNNHYIIFLIIVLREYKSDVATLCTIALTWQNRQTLNKVYVEIPLNHERIYALETTFLVLLASINVLQALGEVRSSILLIQLWYHTQTSWLLTKELIKILTCACCSHLRTYCTKTRNSHY